MSGNTAPLDAQGFYQPVETAPAGLYDAAQVYSGGVDSLAGVGQAELAAFHEQGFLLIRHLLGESEIAAALEAIVELCGGGVAGFQGIGYEARARALLPTLAPQERQDAVRKLSAFVDHDARLRRISEHAGLRVLLRRLLGDEPALFQDMALLKPPRIGREKPWHQDCAYFNLPRGTPVVGVWLALDEALIENGCMHIIPGSQREGAAVHFQRRDWQLCDSEVQAGRILAVPMAPGDCLLFDGLLHHGTPPSQSPRRRRALQFHYRPAAAAFLEDDSERLAIFGAGGRDVSC